MQEDTAGRTKKMATNVFLTYVFVLLTNALFID